jgi:hypothetical protein
VAKSSTSFKKGQSGNPAGKPKQLHTEIRSALAELHVDAVTKLKALIENTDPDVSVKAIKILFDFTLPRPAPVNIGGGTSRFEELLAEAEKRMKTVAKETDDDDAT